jgi:hypothetical protein
MLPQPVSVNLIINCVQWGIALERIDAILRSRPPGGPPPADAPPPTAPPTSSRPAPRVRARQLLAYAVEHLGIGLQVGVADLAVQLDNLLQLGDCPVELPPSAVDHRHVTRNSAFKTDEISTSIHKDLICTYPPTTAHE